MDQQYKRSCFIFHRDLRLHDNNGLALALSHSQLVLPCFIFDIRQIGQTNLYRSFNALQFMIESVNDLENSLKKHEAKLYIFYGKTESLIEKLIETHKLDAVFSNKDYTPFAKQRDSMVYDICKKMGVAFYQEADLLLHEPEDVLTRQNNPYSQFSAFYKNASKKIIKKPLLIERYNYFKEDSFDEKNKKELYTKIIPKKNKMLAVNGGRRVALTILNNLEQFRQYQKERDIPSKPTTHLSAHLKFGTVSAREVYKAISDALSSKHALLRQLYWRDFFTHVAFHFPHVFGQAFKKKYEKIAWNFDEKIYERWCQGMTGFPLVDAGMRQLVQTGFMHNRVRMVAASFLIKDLHIDWRIGEKFFAQHLLDYDPCLNNGNWQWVASTGCDSQPYFRIFNPWLQQKKFDPDALYIKEWIPELRNTNPNIIHTWYKNYHQLKLYPQPIVEHKKEALYAKMLFKKNV